MTGDIVKRTSLSDGVAPKPGNAAARARDSRNICLTTLKRASCPGSDSPRRRISDGQDARPPSHERDNRIASPAFLGSVAARIGFNPCSDGSITSARKPIRPYARGSRPKVRPVFIVQNDRDYQRLLNTIVALITKKNVSRVQGTKAGTRSVCPGARAAGSVSGQRINSDNTRRSRSAFRSRALLFSTPYQSSARTGRPMPSRKSRPV